MCVFLFLLPAMPKYAFESEEAELADYSRKQMQTSIKHNRRELIAVLKKAPHMWVTLNKYAKTLGYSSKQAGQ